MTPCPVCGKPMRRFTQPGHGLVDDRDYEDCQNTRCGFRLVTLAVGDHAKLTPEQIEAYISTNRRIEARSLNVVRYG